MELLSAMTTTTPTSRVAFTVTIATPASAASAAATSTTMLEDNTIVDFFSLFGLLFLLLFVLLSEFFNRLLKLDASVLSIPDLLLLDFSDLVVDVIEADGRTNLNDAKLLNDHNVDVELVSFELVCLCLLDVLVFLLAANPDGSFLFTLMLAHRVLDLAFLDFLIKSLF